MAQPPVHTIVRIEPCGTCSREFVFNVSGPHQTHMCSRCAADHGEATMRASVVRTVEGAEYRRGGGEFVATSVIRDPFGLVYAVYAVASVFLAMQVEDVTDGVPLLVTGIVAGAFAALSFFGRVVVRCAGRQGSVFTGIGSMGWRKRFQWGSVHHVTEVEARFGRWCGHRFTVVELSHSTGQIRFGALLGGERRRFLVDAMRAELTLWRNISSHA